MMYTQMKSHKSLQGMNIKIIISIKYRKISIFFSKNQINIIQNYQEISCNHMKIISMPMRKYLKTYENKQKFTLFRKYLLKKPLLTRKYSYNINKYII